MVVLLKTASVRVSSIQIMQVRVQNKGKSVWKSRYVGDVSGHEDLPPPVRLGGENNETPLPREGRTKDVMQVLFHKHV